MSQYISIYLTEDHRHCDMLLAQAEELVSEKKFKEAVSAVEEFSKAMMNHLEREELILFPAFEERTSMVNGPTQVMRMEHEQVRQLVKQLGEAASIENEKKFFGLSETLLIFVQQHNSKEEQMLYQMADKHLGDISAEIVAKMKDI